MAEDVKLKIGGDTSELEKALSNAIKKIQAEADKLKLTPTAAKSAPGVDSLREAANTSRATQQRVREEKAGLDMINRELAKKKAMIDEIAKQQASAVKASREELVLAERLTKEKDKFQRAERIAQIQRENVRKAEENANRVAGNGRSGLPPIGLSGQQGGSFSGSGSSPLSLLAIPAALVAGMVAATKTAQFAESVRRSFAEAPYRALEIGSSAFNQQGAAGQRISSAFSGEGSREILFGQEIASATANAHNIMEGRLRSPLAPILRPRQSILAGFGTDAQKTQIRNELHDEANQVAAKQLDAIKNGPEGKITTEVKEKYLRDWRRNLEFQRQTGLSEGGFRNFLGGINGAGFQDELGMGASAAIMGAGGSTRSAIGNSAFALQMGRQFDLTNAGQSIGAISGQLGGAQQSKDALIAIQAEGTRIGLNHSEFREENRKFVEMAANVISQSNTSSAAGVDQLLDTFTRFMGGSTTTSGLQAGQNAYERYQSQSNIQSGPSAVMRSAGMRSDPTLGSLTERQRAILSMMPESEITPDSPVIQSMAGGDPKKVQDIVNSAHKTIAESLFVNPTTDTAIGKLRNAKMAAGPFASGESYRQLSLAQGNAAGEASLEEMFSGATEKQRMAGVNALASGDYRGVASLQEEIKKQAASGGAPRPGDEMEKQQAQVSRMANELFTTLKPNIVAASEATAQFATNINALVAAMKSGDTRAIHAAQQNLFNVGGNQTPQEQTHATSGGAPTSGH